MQNNYTALATEPSDVVPVAQQNKTKRTRFVSVVAVGLALVGVVLLVSSSVSSNKASSAALRSSKFAAPLELDKIEAKPVTTDKSYSIPKGGS